ncbi:MAG: L,D-transpeptidase [Verrucomicrobia bacterium]|nr:L,D-transpeptidase [Verrucomicrobiota bacterium]
MMTGRLRVRARPGGPFEAALRWACRRRSVRPTRFLLTVSVARQRLHCWEASTARRGIGLKPGAYVLKRVYVISTSRYGIGQVQDSNRTPLGLHRIARKLGGGWPVGTIFESREPVGWTWQGRPDAAIAHRILWLEGLEPGRNCGEGIDSFKRFIYIHGVGDETTLGRPASRGCIHMAASDLMPLYELLPTGTLVWIAAV